MDFLVDSVAAALTEMTAAGGSVVAASLDIPVGRVAVVADPFGNRLTLLDLSKGSLCHRRGQHRYPRQP